MLLPDVFAFEIKEISFTVAFTAGKAARNDYE